MVGLGGALLLGVGIVRLLRAMALGRPATYLILEIVALAMAVI